MAVTTVLAAFVVPLDSAGDPGPGTGPFLLGSWTGLRHDLARRGIHPELTLTTDVLKNLDGGRRQGTEVLNNVDLTVRIEPEAVGLPLNGTFFLYVLSNFGGDVTSLVGDVQTTSNIEAPATLKLYEAWYEHPFDSGRGSLLFGLHDYNSEFYVVDYGATLIHSSFGIGPDTSQVGPSIFPTTALGTRLRWTLSDQTYVLLGAYDGVPGDPDEERGTHIHLSRHDGLFYAVELGRLAGESDGDYQKLGVGFWYHDTDYVDLSGKRRTHNGGLYALAERSLYRPGDSATHLGGFLQIGIARGDRNELGSYVGAGLRCKGLIASRSADELSVGVAHARNGGAYRRVYPGSRRAETALELTYRAEIRPGLWIQPDLQVIVHPGFDATLDDAIVLGLRVQVSL
jgi:porin